MSIFHITKNNFQEEVVNSDKTVLLDFWADWCVPCKMIAPVLEEIAKEHPEIKIGKINVDQEQELAVQFQVMSIPTLILMKEGKIVNQTVGLQSKSDLLELVDFCN